MAVRHRLVTLVLATLFAATVASADIVITTSEVISCTVVLADTNYVRLRLPPGSIRVLYVRDVYEIRLADSARVAELSASVPQTKVVLDSGQPVPPASERISAVAARRAKPAALPAVPDEVQGWIDANRDAKSSCIGLSWLGGSFLASGLLTFGGGMLTRTWFKPGADCVDPEGWGIALANCLFFSLGVGGGWGIGYTGPAAALLLPHSPPRNRLLGRPSAYVEAYTREYRSTVRRVALPLACAGWVAGGVAGALAAFILTVE